MKSKRLLRWPAVEAKVPYCRMHISRLEKAGLFPKRVQLGENAVAWLEEEVDAWIEARLAARDVKKAA